MLTQRANSRALLLGIVIFCSLTAGCDNGPPRAAVRGSISIAGQPLPAGRILFIPQPPLEAPTVSCTIQEGNYQVPTHEGPWAGTYRVEIEAAPQLGFSLDDEEAFAARGQVMPPNPIPPQYNRQSMLTIELKPGDNTYDVVVPNQPSF